MADLKGKIAWVTGGSSGIGLAGALALAKAGAHVIISGRSLERLDAALGQLDAVGSAEIAPLDTTDKAAIARTVTDIISRHGRIDILVNSAGGNGPKRHFTDMSTRTWDDLIALNLSGLFYCAFEVLPHMRRQNQGTIINVSSWAGRFPSGFTGPAYNTAKRAVIALTESINMEECMNNIRATTILPEATNTEMVDRRPVKVPEAERARMLQPEDLGETILFVAALPARACVNELVISPTWNCYYIGGTGPSTSSTYSATSSNP